MQLHPEPDRHPYALCVPEGGNVASNSAPEVARSTTGGLRGLVSQCAQAYRSRPGNRWVLVAAALALTLVFLPVWSDQNTVNWDGSRASGEQAMLLATAAPDVVTVTLPCTAVAPVLPASEAGPVRLFSTSSDPNVTGTLSLFVSQGFLRWSNGLPHGLVTVARPLSPSADCTITASYDSDLQTMRLVAGTNSSSTDGAFQGGGTTEEAIGPIVTGVWAANQVRMGMRATIVLPPSTISWPLWRWLLVLGVFVSSVLAMRPEVNARKLRRWLSILRHRTRVRKVDLVVLAVLLAVWWLLPPLPDDGWVLTTNRAYPDLGFFSNYYSLSAAPQPQGFWWAFLERLWLFQGSPLWLMRLPSILITWLAWVGLRSLVIDRVSGSRSRTASRWLGAASVCIGAVAWLPSLRPETVVSACVVAIAALIVTSNGRYGFVRLSVIAIVVSLAFTIHQTGLVAVGFALGVVPALYRSVREPTTRVRQSRDAVGALVLGFASTSTLLMLHSSIAVFLDSSAAFADQQSHNYLLDELQRTVQILQSDGPRIATVLALLVAIAVFLARHQRTLQPAATVGHAAVLASTMLLFTSSKWAGHLAITWPLIAILSTAAIAASPHWLRTRRPLYLASAAGTAIFLTVAYRGIALHVFTNDPSRIASTPGRLLGLIAVTAFLGTAGYAAYRMRSRPGIQQLGALVPVGAGLALVVVGGLLAPLLNRGADQQITTPEAWPTLSWPSTSMASVVPGSCGVADQIQVVPEVAPLAIDPRMPPLFNAVSAPVLDRLTALPPASGIPVYAPAAQGVSSTPWFEVDRSTQMQWWVRATGDQTSSIVEFHMTGGGQQQQQVKRLGSKDTWQLMRTAVPAGASSARIGFDRNDGSVSAVTAPMDASKTVPASSRMFGTVWRNPGDGMLLTCAPMPSIRAGTFTPFPWSLGVPAIAPVGPRLQPVSTEAVMAEQGCLNVPGSAPLCLYRIYEPPTRSLFTTTTSVRR